jgi:hypothetical protein
MYQPLNTLPDLVLDSELLGHFMPLNDRLTPRLHSVRICVGGFTTSTHISRNFLSITRHSCSCFRCTRVVWTFSYSR